MVIDTVYNGGLSSLRVDESGQSGLHYAAQVVIHLLDPARPEYSAAFIDKLIIVFIKKVNALIIMMLMISLYFRLEQH